ncbi:MAG: hypothetical protein WCB15_16875, partial [Desulfobacterales bacterium]
NFFLDTYSLSDDQHILLHEKDHFLELITGSTFHLSLIVPMMGFLFQNYLPTQLGAMHGLEPSSRRF